MSIFKKLIGKKVIKCDHEIDFSIAKDSMALKESYDLSSRIYFEDYTLFIYNRHKIINGFLEELTGKQLTNVNEGHSTIDFQFTDLTLKVDITDAGYQGPEAISLYGPDDLIVVWN